jgi:hypothetical protein
MIPRQRALGIASIQQLIRPLGCANRRVLAVLFDQELGGAVSVEIRDRGAGH